MKTPKNSQKVKPHLVDQDSSLPFCLKKHICHAAFLWKKNIPTWWALSGSSPLRNTPRPTACKRRNSSIVRGSPLGTKRLRPIRMNGRAWLGYLTQPNQMTMGQGFSGFCKLFTKHVFFTNQHANMNLKFISSESLFRTDKSPFGNRRPCSHTGSNSGFPLHLPWKKNGEFVSTCKTDQVAAMLSTNQQPWRGHIGAKVMKLYAKKGTPQLFGDVIWIWDSPNNSDQEKPKKKTEHGSSTPEVDVDGLITWWNIQNKSIVDVVFHPSWKKSTRYYSFTK